MSDPKMCPLLAMGKLAKGNSVGGEPGRTNNYTPHCRREACAWWARAMPNGGGCGVLGIPYVLDDIQSALDLLAGEECGCDPATGDDHA